MSMPTPYEIASTISNNIGGVQREVRENRSIDQILTHAKEHPEQSREIMGQILRNVSPERQPAALAYFKQIKATADEKIQQQEMFGIGESLEANNPDNKLYKTVADIYRSNLPLEQKNKMIEGISKIVPYKLEQQKRLNLDSILNRYSKRIKEIDESLKLDMFNEELQAQKKALQDERDSLLEFKALEKQVLPEFDPNTPEHMNDYQEAKKRFKNDKAKINAFLGKKYQ